MAAYKDLELLVTKIQKQLAPNAQVTHNVKLPGRHTGIDRQIDVLVHQQVGQYPINVIIDCKDHQAPVDVKGVEEFNGLLDDVGAQKGVLVSPAGFTSTAKTRAEKLQIDLYSPVDTDPHKWQVKATIPVVCDFRSAGISFRVGVSAPYPFAMPDNFFEQMVFDEEDRELGSMIDAAAAKWNDGKWPITPGTHSDMKIFDADETRMDNGYDGGIRCSVDLSASIFVESRLYFGQFDVTSISGFADHIRGGVITNAFTVGMLDPNEVMEKWQKIERVEDAPQRPVLSVRGLVAWLSN
jgi:hypothetical protein